jgi:cell division protein FtsB
MTVEEEIARLRAENEELRQQIGVLEQRIRELEGKSGDQPPPFVKRNRPKREGPKQARKKRDAKHNHARHREPPTQSVEHVLDRCPECNYHLRGTSLDYVRQVIELPPPEPVEVTEHRVVKRYCPKCESWQSPKLDLSGQVLGQGRMGVRLASLVAFLRTSLRLPVRTIQSYLEQAHQLTVSVGEIVYLLEQVREATKAELAELKSEVQRSGIVHADETGWREDGENGYIWTFVTPGEQGIRYYEFDPSRSHEVVSRVLDDKFHGHLVSDFYAAYNDYGCRKQRCWTHFLRDLHELKAKHADKPEVVKWAQDVRALYDEAQEWLGKAANPSREQREAKYVSLVGRAHQLGMKHSPDKGHSCWALAKRILRHEDELFQFVLVEGLSASNNLAERSIRPLVVVRKISGGSRSPSGTKPRMALASLFGTWTARGLNPFAQCLVLLTQQSAPSPP